MLLMGTKFHCNPLKVVEVVHFIDCLTLTNQPSGASCIYVPFKLFWGVKINLFTQYLRTSIHIICTVAHISDQLYKSKYPSSEGRYKMKIPRAVEQNSCNTQLRPNTFNTKLSLVK